MQPQERRQENVRPVAETNEIVANEEGDPAQGDDGEQLEASTEEAGGKR
jgi:hypothetical protein